MLSSAAVNPGQPLARLAQISADQFPGIGLQGSSEVESDFGAYLTDQFKPLLPEERMQKLLRQSMEAELFADTRSGAVNKQAVSGLMRGAVKAAYSFAILQEQQNLLGLPSRQTLGYG